jgi:hypothetical protein
MIESYQNRWPSHRTGSALSLYIYISIDIYLLIYIYIYKLAFVMPATSGKRDGRIRKRQIGIFDRVDPALVDTRLYLHEIICCLFWHVGEIRFCHLDQKLMFNA